MQELKLIDPNFSTEEGVVGFTLNKALHTEISDGFWLPSGEFSAAEDDRGIGYHTMLSFWAYGNDEGELFSNLGRVFKNIWAAFRLFDKSITDATSGL